MYSLPSYSPGGFDYDNAWSHPENFIHAYLRNTCDLSVKPFRLLELPLEVRQLVYKTLIGNGEIQLVNRQQAGKWFYGKGLLQHEIFEQLVPLSAIAPLFACTARAKNRAYTEDPAYVYPTDAYPTGAYPIDASMWAFDNNPTHLEAGLKFPPARNPRSGRNVCKALLYTSRRMQKEALPVFLSHGFISIVPPFRDTGMRHCKAIGFWSFGCLGPNLAQFVQRIDISVQEYYDYMQLEDKFGSLQSLFPNIRSIGIRGCLAHPLEYDRHLQADPQLWQVVEMWDKYKIPKRSCDRKRYSLHLLLYRKVYQELGKVLAYLVYEPNSSTGKLERRDVFREEYGEDFPLNAWYCSDSHGFCGYSNEPQFEYDLVTGTVTVRDHHADQTWKLQLDSMQENWIWERVDEYWKYPHEKEADLQDYQLEWERQKERDKERQTQGEKEGENESEKESVEEIKMEPGIEDWTLKRIDKYLEQYLKDEWEKSVEGTIWASII